jgi:phosphate transport system substrate-binding protein
MLQLTRKILFAVAVTLFGLCLASLSNAQPQKKLLAGGCVTEYYLMRDLVSKFNSNSLTINILKTGNVKGMDMFAKGTIDFAFLSTPHTMLAKTMGIPKDKTMHMKSIEIANEPILVVVNPATHVDTLTKEQVVAIYNGEIRNWKEVGGADIEIVPASMNESAESGLWAAFKKMTIGMNNDFKGNLVALKDPVAIKHFLKRNSGGITYMGLASYNESVGVALALDGNEPTMDNFQNASYPLVAKYYLAYNNDNPQSVQSFIDFIYSPEGKAIVNSNMIAAEPLS